MTASVMVMIMLMFVANIQLNELVTILVIITIGRDAAGMLGSAATAINSFVIATPLDGGDNIDLNKSSNIILLFIT